MVVGDVEDVFIPLSHGFLVSPVESRTQIESLLDNLPNLVGSNRSSEACLGSAVKAVSMGLVHNFSHY